MRAALIMRAARAPKEKARKKRRRPHHERRNASFRVLRFLTRDLHSAARSAANGAPFWPISRGGTTGRAPRSGARNRASARADRGHDEHSVTTSRRSKRGNVCAAYVRDVHVCGVCVDGGKGRKGKAPSWCKRAGPHGGAKKRTPLQHAPTGSAA